MLLFNYRPFDSRYPYPDKNKIFSAPFAAKAIRSKSNNLEGIVNVAAPSLVIEKDRSLVKKKNVTIY